MALLSFFLSLSTIVLGIAQQSQTTIIPGSSLTPTSNTMWLSSSGLYAFGFYPQSNGYRIGIFLAGVPQKTVVWTANQDDAPVVGDAILAFDAKGQLILQVKENNTYRVIDTKKSASFASMLDSGNFILYDSNQKITWQSFDHPTNTILSGQTLPAGAKLLSSLSETEYSIGIFRLEMQTDGNLVQYPINTPNTTPYSYWVSFTDGTGNNVSLNLDTHGQLYLLNSVGINIKNLTDRMSSEAKTIYLMRLDSDGILRLYSHSLDLNGNWSILWSSLNNKCDPLGFCGRNAYCINKDDQVDCRCLPGFDPVSPNNQHSGCERNFTPNSCKTNAVVNYTTEVVANFEILDSSYLDLQLSTKEDCEKACLEDCTCDIATFIDEKCRKQQLPIRFGRKKNGVSSIVFIKLGAPTISPSPNVQQKKPKREVRILVIGVSIAIVNFIVFACAMLWIFILRKQIVRYRRNIENGEMKFSEDFGPRLFTYDELLKATDGFKEVLGKGSFGTVYRGKISNSNEVVAIKRLDKVLEEREIEFQMEMKVIARTHHRNLIKLLGYCVEGPNRLLVYEYMSNGSLADILFVPEKKPCWDERIRIALNIARGILYLHEECDTQIIHCDIKPQNILLDEYGNTKICDFGLAKLLKLDQTNTYTGIRGTRGYVAPEWFRKLPVTIKTDIYSFGIVLFEIICCRRTVELSAPDDQVVIEQWVYDCFEVGKLHNLLNDEVVDFKQLERMVKVGLWCIQDEPSVRPSMKDVVLMLEGMVDVPIPPSPTSFLTDV